jgi:hypothetical protein
VIGSVLRLDVGEIEDTHVRRCEIAPVRLGPEIVRKSIPGSGATAPHRLTWAAVPPTEFSVRLRRRVCAERQLTRVVAD